MGIKSIHNENSYGKVDIALNKVMSARNVNMYKLNKATDLSYSTIRAYKNNMPITRIDLDVLAKLCYALDCDISDILVYRK